MSATKDVTIWCDGPGCHSWTYGGGQPLHTVALAREAARKLGWKCYRPGGRTRDLCPVCAERSA